MIICLHVFEMVKCLFRVVRFVSLNPSGLKSIIQKCAFLAVRFDIGFHTQPFAFFYSLREITSIAQYITLRVNSLTGSTQLSNLLKNKIQRKLTD